MRHILSHRNLRAADNLTQRDIVALIETATDLKRAAQRGEPLQLLRGRNIALLSDDHGGPSAVAFHRAATALGAQVARVPATDPLGRGPQELRDRARLLGRLYSAIECQGLPEQDVWVLDHESGVPVYNEIGGANHPTRVLAALMTLCELSGQPLGRIKLALRGRASGERLAALVRVMELSGVSLRLTSPVDQPVAVEAADHVTAEPLSAAGETAHDTEFSGELQGDTGLALALDMGRVAPAAVVAAEQIANQRYLLEAMLACTVA